MKVLTFFLVIVFCLAAGCSDHSLPDYDKINSGRIIYLRQLNAKSGDYEMTLVEDTTGEKITCRIKGRDLQVGTHVRMKITCTYGLKGSFETFACSHGEVTQLPN